MFETIIIGGGIAGMTAAIYASRKKMDFLLLASEPGGQFMVSGEVLNYPGIVKTTGVEFFQKMQEQLKFNGIEMKRETAQKIKKIDDHFKVLTDKGEYETQTVILATGARARRLSVPGEDRLDKKGVTYCSVCDGPIFQGQDVAIIGGGNSALEAVDFMAKIAKKIYLIVNTDKLNGHEYLIDNVKKVENLEILYNTDTKEILGDNFVSGLRVEQSGEQRDLDVRGVIIEIGRVPNTQLVEGLLDLDPQGHILVDCQGHTSIPGIFAGGDCAAGHEFQYIIAAGQGCMCLLKAARYLANKKQQ